VTKTITFNGTVYACPYIDALPPLSPEERAELQADIAQHGVMVPVLVTEADEVLDGHNRLTIAAELGLTAVPVQVVRGLSESQKRDRAEDLNLHRRHLTRDQKREVIARRLKSDPARSNNAIATELKVSDTTVAKVRAELESTSQIGKLVATRGRDGKTRRRRGAIGQPARATEGDSHAKAGPVPRTEKPFPWWPALAEAASYIGRLAADLKRLAKVRVAERDPSEVLRVIKQLRHHTDALEHRTTKGGK
jgi:ParB/RepB/Spo0J family partition protein